MIRRFQKGGDPKKTESGASTNMIHDMEFLEQTLKESKSRFLCGDTVTAADCMMYFMLLIPLVKLSDLSDKQYAAVERYMQDCEATESFKKVIGKVGSILYNERKHT